MMHLEWLAELTNRRVVIAGMRMIASSGIGLLRGSKAILLDLLFLLLEALKSHMALVEKHFMFLLTHEVELLLHLDPATILLFF